MVNRREFLEAAAISALPAIAGATPRTGAVSAKFSRSGVHTVLIDDRYVEARTVGARLAAMGTTVRAIPDGDVTQTWLTHIGPAWKQEAVTIAGLTARPALFCLEQFALSCGLRVVYHGEHVVHQAGRTEHRILRSTQVLRTSVHDLALAGRFWPALLAELLVTDPGPVGSRRVGRSDAALSPSVPPGARLLNSWVIASA